MALQASSPGAGAVSVIGATDKLPYVDWPAAIAGAVLAAAIAFVLLTFGSAVGLTLTSPYRGEGAALPWFAIAVGLWLVWVQLASFMAGAYMAGRLRRRIGDSTPHESDVRDGAHGILVWALGVIIATLLTVGGITAAAKTATQAVGSAASGLSQAAGQAVGRAAPGEAAGDASAYFIDRLFRTDRPRDSATAERSRAAVGRIFARAAAGTEIGAADRPYLTSLVAAETGLSPAEAEARVTEIQAEMKAAADRARDAAEKARKIGILLGFVTAASLLISAAAAYFAAGVGGQHRDEGQKFPGWGRL